MADDNIIPLRHSYALSMVERISELEAENERLQAAGDALVATLRRHQMACGVNDASTALAAWQEARRG